MSQIPVSRFRGTRARLAALLLAERGRACNYLVARPVGERYLTGLASSNAVPRRPRPTRAPPSPPTPATSRPLFPLRRRADEGDPRRRTDLLEPGAAVAATASTASPNTAASAARQAPAEGLVEDHAGSRTQPAQLAALAAHPHLIDEDFLAGHRDDLQLSRRNARSLPRSIRMMELGADRPAPNTIVTESGANGGRPRTIRPGIAQIRNGGHSSLRTYAPCTPATTTT